MGGGWDGQILLCKYNKLLLGNKSKGFLVWTSYMHLFPTYACILTIARSVSCSPVMNVARKWSAYNLGVFCVSINVCSTIPTKLYGQAGIFIKFLVCNKFVTICDIFSINHFLGAVQSWVCLLDYVVLMKLPLTFKFIANSCVM